VYINKCATDQEKFSAGRKDNIQRIIENHQQISSLLPAIGFSGKKQQYKRQHGGI
jgi:hypothetical protein